MSDVPSNLKYSKSHEWIEVSDDIVTIGISDHAQDLLGDLVYVELPEVGNEINAGDACAVVESVKAASDVYTPLSGEIIEVNDALADNPELINQSPYGDGWIYKLRLSEVAELDDLLDADAYTALAAEEEH
ncbi:MAG: glycine cleavage system protein GcvH [Gammaproteobacteria bacterium]|nr:glycine cleavage system protein GcvH [Gammaproteobacteria bacterium]MDH5728706.1 glycine cleavage system protein GcvH [Gammaproteobacteria bacterium]